MWCLRLDKIGFPLYNVMRYNVICKTAGGNLMHNRLNRILIKLVALICAISTLALFTVSCNGGDEDQTSGEKYHTVTFNTNGGSIVESIKVLDNHYASRPEDPTLENHIFSRWEKDGKMWLFDTKKITESMTLSALWVPAVELFELEPDEKSSGLLLAGFKKQASFKTLNVPSTINGKTVVGITAEGFENTSVDHAEKIILPESIVYVGDSTFRNSAEIEIEILGTLLSIGESTFENCAKLEKVKLGNGITSIPFMCFSGCSSLRTIDLPETVTTIEENAFEKASSMISVVVPTSLTSVEDSAFMNCPSLRTIFYKGTAEQFEAIDIADGNEAFEDAKVYLYSEEQPSDDGDYWHYENGSAMIW